MHKVTSVDILSLIVLLFQDHLLKLLNSSIFDLLEFVYDSLFISGCCDVLTELRVDLAHDALQPVANLVVGQLDLLVHVKNLFVLLLLGLQLCVQFVDF